MISIKEIIFYYYSSQLILDMKKRKECTIFIFIAVSRMTRNFQLTLRLVRSFLFGGCVLFYAVQSTYMFILLLQIEVTETNGDNYLSAGEMPLPMLYFIMSTVFLASGCFWVGVLCKSKYVYLMNFTLCKIRT